MQRPQRRLPVVLAFPFLAVKETSPSTGRRQRVRGPTDVSRFSHPVLPRTIAVCDKRSVRLTRA